METIPNRKRTCFPPGRPGRRNAHREFLSCVAAFAFAFVVVPTGASASGIGTNHDPGTILTTLAFLAFIIAFSLALAFALSLTLFFRERARSKFLQATLVRSELMASLGKLVASVTHDINSSVGVCVSAASYLDESIDVASRAFTEGTLKKSDLARHFALEKETADILALNLKKAADLVAGFKRISVDQATLSLQEFGLREYIDQIVMSLTPKLRKTPHHIEILCDSSLRMQGYPWAISQILTNLISNSLTHAFGEKKQGTMCILAEKQGDRLILTYSDDGRGMSEYVRSRAFTPFFTTNPQDGGTGLGLSIVRDLAENVLSGSIVCESTPGEGTIFTLNIPLVITAQGAGPEGSHHKEKRS